MRTIFRPLEQVTIQRFCEEHDFSVCITQTAAEEFNAEIENLHGFLDNHRRSFDIVGSGDSAEASVAALAKRLSGTQVYLETPTTNRHIMDHGGPPETIAVPNLCSDPDWKLKRIV